MLKVFFIFLFLFSVLETNVNAKIIKLEKCFSENSYSFDGKQKNKWSERDYLTSNVLVWDNKFNEWWYYYGSDIQEKYGSNIDKNDRYKLFYRLEENSFTINTQNSLVTHSRIYSDFFYEFEKNKYEKKYNKNYPGKQFDLDNYKIFNFSNNRIFANKKTLSNWDLILDLNKNTVYFEIERNYSGKREVTSFKYYCQPFGSVKKNGSANTGFLKNFLGIILGK